MKPYEEFKLKLKSLKENAIRPTLLLHSCCGPCSAHVLMLLHDYFEITILYYNPNIYPKEEFDKRLLVQKELLKKLPFHVGLMVVDDDYSVFLNAVHDYLDFPEKSMRCYCCYKFRMEKLSEIASKEGFDYFTTTLSVSPHKNSSWINEIGNSLSGKSIYLYSDFKKENGYLDSTMLAKKYELYRQDYCGCGFSLNEAIKRKEKKEEICK